MADVVFVLLTIAFFAIAAAFVRACDRIVGAGDDVATDEIAEPVTEEVAA
jgi:hypothetical protein